MLLESVIRNWAAWAPGLNSLDDWQQWSRGCQSISDAPPPISQAIPKALQRRLSPLAKAVFHVIEQCVEQHPSLPAVFSSAHGEIGRSLQMLECLQVGEALSPTAFSLSVHNAIAGLYSMAYGNRQEIAVLAPAAAGLGAGFIEALGMLREGHAEVLLVFYDERLPAFYPTEPFALSSPFPCALALRLSGVGEGLPIGFGLSSTARQDGEQPLQLPAFIKFLLSDAANLQLGEQGQSWQWQKI